MGWKGMKFGLNRVKIICLTPSVKIAHRPYNQLPAWGENPYWLEVKFNTGESGFDIFVQSFILMEESHLARGKEKNGSRGKFSC